MLGFTPAIVMVDTEGEPDFLFILHRRLLDLAEGFEIITVFSSEEALARVQSRIVPLVITGYKIHRMDGLQLTAAIKEHSSQTRVVLITAYATPQLESQARHAFVDYYLPKPFSLDRIEHIVQEVLATTPMRGPNEVA